MKIITPALRKDNIPAPTGGTYALTPLIPYATEVNVPDYVPFGTPGIFYVRSVLIELSAPITAGQLAVRVLGGVVVPDIVLTSVSPLKQIVDLPDGLWVKVEDGRTKYPYHLRVGHIASANLLPAGSLDLAVSFVVDDGDVLPAEGTPDSPYGFRTPVLNRNVTVVSYMHAPAGIPLSRPWPLLYTAKLGRVVIWQIVKTTAGTATLRIKKNGVVVKSIVVASTSAVKYTVDLTADNISFTKGDTFDADVVCNSSYQPRNLGYFFFAPVWFVTA